MLQNFIGANKVVVGQVVDGSGRIRGGLDCSKGR